MTGVLDAGVVEIEVDTVEGVTVELEAAGLEDGIVEDEAGTFELLGLSVVVLLPVVVPGVTTFVLQAELIAIDATAVPSAVTPIRFKNCRLENLATRKIFRFSRVSFPSFSGIYILLQIFPSQAIIERPRRLISFSSDINVPAV